MNGYEAIASVLKMEGVRVDRVFPLESFDRGGG